MITTEIEVKKGIGIGENEENKKISSIRFCQAKCSTKTECGLSQSRDARVLARSGVEKNNLS